MEATLLVGRIQENLGTEWSSTYSLSRFTPHLCQSIAREQRADEKNSGMARTQRLLYYGKYLRSS